MSTETGTDPAGESRVSAKCRRKRGEMSTPQKQQQQAEAESDCPSKKIRLAGKSHSTGSHHVSSERKAGRISEGAEAAREAGRTQQQLLREQHKRQSRQRPQQQQLKQEQESKAQHEAAEDARVVLSRKKRKMSSSSRVAASGSDTASSRDVLPPAAGPAAVPVSRSVRSSSAGATSASNDSESERSVVDAASLSRSDAGTQETDTHTEGGSAVCRKDGIKKKKKRKRRDCWDLATVAEQKAQLLQQLKDRAVREKLSKSRLKRLKARLSLLAKAERGEVQVGGQLLPSGKRRTLLEKIKRKKEERKKTGVSDTVEDRKRRILRRKEARLDGRERRGDPQEALAKRKRTKKICLNCRRRGHLLEDCSAAVAATPCVAVDNADPTVTGSSRSTLRPAMSGICFNCGSKEHTLKNCKKPRESGGILPFALCFVCGKGGHISSQCPDSKTGKYPKGGCCRTCGSIFHLQADCPEFKNRQATTSAAAQQASHAKDRAIGSHRGPKQRQSTSLPLTVSHRTGDEIDPDEQWGI